MTALTRLKCARKGDSFLIENARVRPVMGLTLTSAEQSPRRPRPVIRRASKRGKSRILDELCANTGWHRSHARKALKTALAPKIVTRAVPGR